MLYTRQDFRNVRNSFSCTQRLELRTLLQVTFAQEPKVPRWLRASAERGHGRQAAGCVLQAVFFWFGFAGEGGT